MAERPLSELSYGELLEEIKREETHLTELQESLEGANNQINELKKALQEELSLIDIARHRDREERIRILREEIETKREQFRRVRAGIEARTELIREREASRAFYLRRSRDPLVGIIQREVARSVAESLRRSVSSLRGWQTRKRELRDTLREELRQLGRTLGGYRRWQIEEEDLAKRIAELEESLAFWEETKEDIETDIKAEQDHLELKREELKKRRVLSRIKIRLYNMERRAPTPEGMFQGLFEIDAIIDPATEEPDWGWWLTREEIEIAKYHMVGYFKGMAKWHPPGQLNLSYFTDEGIPHEEEAVSYKRKGSGEPYVKRVPSDFIRRAETLTVKELIVGESSKAPEPNTEPSRENMGVYFEDAYIIDEYGVVKWHDRRHRWAYHPTEEQITRVKEEIGLE